MTLAFALAPPDPPLASPLPPKPPPPPLLMAPSSPWQPALTWSASPGVTASVPTAFPPGGAQLAVTLPATRDDAGRLLNLIEDASCIKT